MTEVDIKRNLIAAIAEYKLDIKRMHKTNVYLRRAIFQNSLKFQRQMGTMWLKYLELDRKRIKYLKLALDETRAA